MPSEALPWDRKDVFLKERRQERVVGSDALGGGDVTSGGSCSTSRWRESYHGPRDCSRSSPRRPLAGHYRYNGGYHQHHPEESGGHGCTPSRSGDRFCPEEEILRHSSVRSGADGRSISSGGRESRGSSRRSPCLDSGSDCNRQRHFSPVTAQRSVVVPVTYTSCSSSSSILLKSVVDKSDGGVIDGSGTCQRYDQDHSLSSIFWKPLKWNRPMSLSLSKTLPAESEEACLEISVPLVKESPVTSPLKSHLLSDDRATNKKPRLGWGQGLAKYEKQKVEGSVDVSGQNGSVQSANSGKDFVCDSSPKFSTLPGSVSPATPTSASATCSTSPACAEEKLSRVLNAETETSQCNNSYALQFHNSPENISINFDGLDSNYISTLDSLLTNLMQPEEACSGDSSLTRHSTLNKLLLLKKGISKELERTECEIDLFENKLKSNNCDMQSNYQENSILSPSVDLREQHAVHIHLPEDHSVEAKDTNYNSTGTIICDVDQMACSERENINSSTSQSDMCPLNNTDDKSPLPDDEPLVHSAVSSPSDLCNGEFPYHLDLVCKNADDNSVALILTYNKHAAERASQEFDHAMPTGISQFNLWESDNILQCSKNYMHVRGKIAMNKRLLNFKERVLALKFRALHHLWREDLNLLTMKKNRPKSNKRSEVNNRLPQLALQKNRSSTRTRYALSGNLTLVPTTEILNFTSKLLSDSQVKIYRNNLKMPAQIIDERDKKYSRYKSYNGLIEDPSALEKERKMMNPWMPEEKQVFLDMLATFGKYFKKISSYIPRKTTADCVEFYYKNHKSESFTEVTRQLKLRKQWQNSHSNTYLMTSGTRFNREVNATSLELLGSASIMAAESNCIKRSIQKTSGCKVSRRINGLLEKAGSEISGSEKEVAAVDMLAGICCALSSDAVSSCVTSSIDFPEKMHFSAIDRSLTSEAAHQTIDEEEGCSDESSDGMESADSADWNDDEKTMFIRAFNMYGKDFVKVAHFVRTRSRDQCKIFFSKARKCLGLDAIQPGSTNGVMPTSDANEGRSGTDDACSTQSCSKMDADFTQSIETCSEGRVHTCNTTLLTDADKSCAQCDIDGSVPDEVEGKFDISSSSVLKEEDKKSFVCAKTDNGNASDVLSPRKFMLELNSEDKLKSQITLKAPLKDSKVDSNQPVLLDLSVENRPRVKMEESGAGDDPFILGPCSHSNGEWCSAVQQKISGCPNYVLSTNFQHEAPLELLWSLSKESQTRKVGMPELAVSSRSNHVLPDLSSTSFNEVDMEISVQNLQDGGKCEQKPVIGDLVQDLLKTTFQNPIDSFSPMASEGDQLLLQNHKKLKVDSKLIDEKSPIGIPAVENRTSDSNCSIISESRCAGVVLNSRREHIWDRHLSEEKSGLVESGGQSRRVGDLKLFGQILSHPSTHKLSSLQEGAKVNATSNSSAASKDAAILAPVPGSNKTLTHFLGELPQRSYDFWESNRIQGGLSCYQVSAGMPFCTGFDSDFPQQAQVLSEKKLLEPFPPELQKRNGFDVLSSLQQPQQQLRMVQLEVSMVGAGVSEPVAALQMHYSGGRAKILTGDLETLTGDTGGR